MVLGTVASAPLMLGMGAMVAVAADPNFNLTLVEPVIPYVQRGCFVPSLCCQLRDVRWQQIFQTHIIGPVSRRRCGVHYCHSIQMDPIEDG